MASCLRLFVQFMRLAASRSILDGGQQQADEHRDDGDHHQQLDQREAAASPG